jgi:uncharacterized protein (DUF1330 family)
MGAAHRDLELIGANGGTRAMSAYLVCWIDVRDLETYFKYAAQASSIVAQYGGRFLVRGGEVQTIEGEPFEGRLVVVEFPSVAVANLFYNSPEYQAAKSIREPVSTARIVLVSGVEPAPHA